MMYSFGYVPEQERLLRGKTSYKKAGLPLSQYYQEDLMELDVLAWGKMPK